jgi:hypothetical protein
MMEHSNTSVAHPDVSVDLAGGGVTYPGRAGGAQLTRVCSAMALASALAVGGSVQALAADPPDPAANKVWGGCQLSPTTLSNLELDLKDGGIPQPEVSFVVVYTLKNANDGQRLSGTSITGPVICTDSTTVGITAFDNFGEAGGPTHLLKETTDIPTETHTVPPTTTINVLGGEEAFILQYQLNNGANPLPIEKRICHTTGNNVDCFRIFEAQ